MGIIRDYQDGRISGSIYLKLTGHGKSSGLTSNGTLVLLSIVHSRFVYMKMGGLGTHEVSWVRRASTSPSGGVSIKVSGSWIRCN